MNTRSLTLLTLAAILWIGCSPNVFTTEVKGETLVKGSPIAQLLSTFPIGNFTNMDFNANQDFQNQGVTKDQVSSVKVDSIKLKILDPATQNFKFLETLQFVAKSGDDETLVAEKADIASLPGLEPPNPTLVMDVKGAELRNHVTAPSMSILVRGNGRQPDRDVRIEATVLLRITVKVF